MSNEVIVALIAASGVIITAGITLVGYIFTKRHNEKVIFNQTVSERRNIWLNEMREYISEMLAQADISQNKDNMPMKYYKAKNQVLLRLNLIEPLHKMLSQQIESLDNCENYQNTRDKIIEILQAILKEEWEKVKSEAKGEK